MRSNFHFEKKGFIFLGLLLVSLLSACHTLTEKPSSIPFHECYERIIDSDADQFVKDAIDVLHAEYGGSAILADAVHLRHSKRNSIGQLYRLAENFSKTEVIGPREVVIYIAVPPRHDEFYPMLGHECGHLLNPEIVGDWRMEGFCMLFSEELCERSGYSWDTWRKRYPQCSSDPYARAYWDAKKRLNSDP